MCKVAKNYVFLLISLEVNFVNSTFSCAKDTFRGGEWFILTVFAVLLTVISFCDKTGSKLRYDVTVLISSTSGQLLIHQWIALLYWDNRYWTWKWWLGGYLIDCHNAVSDYLLYDYMTLYYCYFCLMSFIVFGVKCLYSGLFWSAFSCIQIEYGEIFCISPYPVRMRESAAQNNSEYGHFLRSESSYIIKYLLINSFWTSVKIH